MKRLGLIVLTAATLAATPSFADKGGGHGGGDRGDRGDRGDNHENERHDDKRPGRAAGRQPAR